MEYISQDSLPFLVYYLIHHTPSLPKNEQYLFEKFVYKSLSLELKNSLFHECKCLWLCQKPFNFLFFWGLGNREEVLYLFIAETTRWKMKKQNNTNELFATMPRN